MNLLWYWMLDPPRGGIIDRGEAAAFTQHLRGPEEQELEASLFLDEHGEPHFVKVRALGARDIYDTDRFVDLVAVAQAHMLSVLKLAWHPNASYVPMSFFQQEAEDGSGAGLQVTWPSAYGFNSAQAHALYEHTFGHRESLRLLADGLDERVPIQYRFLSLYKFLEIRYRGDSDHWDFGALRKACDAQLREYDGLKLPRSFQAELKHLRDRCAHIRTGSGKKRRLGVTALNPEALKEVTRMMPLLTEICRIVFNSELDGKVVFNDLRSWGERAMSEPAAKKTPPELSRNLSAAKAQIE
jgi:hypothetical protein